MNFIPMALAGVVIVEPDVYRDGSGFFVESYSTEKYREIGAPTFVQDNHSRSARGTLRGMHAQLRRPQAKLVRVVHGEIFDVVVDIRRGSPTFGKWESVVLSEENFRQCYVPPGFAHGFCVLSEFADVEYKCSDFYDPGGELRLRWNDPAIAIAWPVLEPRLSDKDASAELLAALMDRLPHFDGAG